jgi:hypothetical protein
MDFSPRLRERFSALNLLIVLFTVIIMFSMTGCVATIPVVVKFIEKERQYTAKLEVPKEADEIYQIVVREIEKLPDVRIIRKDDSKLSVEASRAEQTTRITALTTGAGKSMVAITADAGKNWEDSKELAQRVVRRICQEVNMQCQLIVE